MREIQARDISQTVSHLCIEASRYLPDDVLSALQQAEGIDLWAIDQAEGDIAKLLKDRTEPPPNWRLRAGLPAAAMTRVDTPSASPFYVTGGTLPPDASSYVERQADRDLLSALVSGEQVVRGGSFYHDQTSSRSANREVVEATFRDLTLGMRVCASLAK